MGAFISFLFKYVLQYRFNFLCKFLYVNFLNVWFGLCNLKAIWNVAIPTAVIFVPLIPDVLIQLNLMILNRFIDF